MEEKKNTENEEKRNNVNAGVTANEDISVKIDTEKNIAGVENVDLENSEKVVKEPFNKFNKKENGKEQRGRRQRGFGGRGKKAAERQKSEFETKVISARRVARVVAGGRRFSLSVTVVAGNGKGKVGIGMGKGPDMAIAMEKAKNQAQKRAIQLKLTDDGGIPSEVIGKCCASVVQLRPSKGFVAGGAVRVIAELAGIHNLNAKILSRSKSHLNNAVATVNALQSMKG